jgi:predicted acylesterase/phospholipase RssA
VGLTLIQRSQGRRIPKNPKIALVLAGGAISGGAFKVGGLKAFDEFLVGRKSTDFDLYVGLSAGAFLATSLAAGIVPDEMIATLDGSSARFSQLRPIDFYRPNVQEFAARPVLFAGRVATYLPGLLLDLLSLLPDLPQRVGPSFRRFFDEPSYTHLESFLLELFREVSPKREFPGIGSVIPAGLFDNGPLERWLAANMSAVGMPNDFAELYRESGKRLYLTATNLDTAERVVFGPDDDHGLTISQAVQASSALPGFFRPARINGVDYVDGGVRRTANIDVAIEQGADLVICYNPFRPFLNSVVRDGSPRLHYLSDRGLRTVLNQVLRTMLHTRLALGLRAYLHDESFRGDIVVIEPRETDETFFDLNPLAFWKRSHAVAHGFESVRRTLLDHADVLGPLLARYGLEFRPPAEQPAAGDERPGPERTAGAHLRAIHGAAAG